MTNLSKFFPPSPPRTKGFYLDEIAKLPVEDRKFYECGCCGTMHFVQWNGDCREDAARFDIEDLDEKFGEFDGWEEVEMPGGEDDA